jgi:hypothetical protein
MQSAYEQDRERFKNLTHAHEAGHIRGRGNPESPPPPPAALVAAWSTLPPVERLRRLREWQAQQAGVTS